MAYVYLGCADFQELGSCENCQVADTCAEKQRLGGFLKKIIRSASRVYGGVTQIVGKMMPAEFANAIPKELGPVLKALGPVAQIVEPFTLAFPPAFAAITAIKYAGYAQQAAEARRDLTKYNQMKSAVNAMNAEAKKQGVVIDVNKFPPSEMMAYLDKQLKALDDIDKPYLFRRGVV